MTSSNVQESFYKFLFNQVNDSIIIFDPESEVILEANDSALQLYGFPRSEFIGMSLKKITKDTQKGSLVIKNLLSSGKLENFETIHYNKNGEEINLLGNASLINYKNKTAVLAVNRNITDFKENRKLFLELEEKYHSIFYHTTVGIYRTDPAGNILLANPALASLFGYDSLEEFLSKTAEETYLYKEKRDEFKTILEREGEVLNYQNVGLKKDGSVVYFNESARCIKDSQGKILYYDGVMEDITELKLYEKELIKAKETAEKASETKEIFLNNMTHELRTPLVGVLGYSEFLAAELNNNELKDMALDIKTSGTRLLRTFDQILYYTKLLSSKFDITLEKINLVEILKGIFKSFMGLANLKNLDYRLESDNSSLMIFAETAALKVILENVIDNALKFTSHGSVLVQTGVENFDGQNWVFVKIADTGIGIKKDNIDTIFEPFKQVSEGMSRKFEGTGLGLAITKQYMDLLGGRILINSDEFKGSSFTILFNPA